MKNAAMIGLVMALLLFVAPSPASHGQSDGDTPALPLEARIDQFWKLWETQQPSEALRRLSSSPQNPWTNLYQVVDGYHSRLGGRCLGHAQIERKKVTDKIVYVSFYAYYDIQPVRVELLYYKARDRWNGIACHVDINTNQWLHEIAHPQDGGATPPTQDAQPGARD
jgi:hypothetical protein